jgi:hypothetical protein
MNAAKHTPGPWEVCRWETKRIVIRPVYPTPGCTTGFAPLAVVGGDKRTVTEAGKQANARLIAAAPELLEAAEAALLYDEALRSCRNDPREMASFCTAQGDDLDALYDDWIKKSRAAIAKFVGGAA